MSKRKPDRRKRIRPHRDRALERKQQNAAAKRNDQAERIVEAVLISAIEREPTPHCSDAMLDVIRGGLNQRKEARKA
jgi:hypothetical protein